MADFAKIIRSFYSKHGLLVNVLLIALILRLAYLNAIASMVFDENFYIPAAKQILAAGIDPNIEHPPLAKFILAASIWLFGDSPLSWRVFPVLFGLAAATFFYFIALELTRNKRLAALSAALLAFDPLNMVFSRIAMLDVFMLAFMLGGAYFALKRDWSLTGFLFGLSIASKWPAVLGLLAVTIFLYLRKKLRPADAAYLVVIAALTYVLVCTPLIVQQGPAEWASSQIYNIGKTSGIPTANEQASVALEWLVLQKPVWLTWNKPDFAPPADLLWLTNILGGQAALGVVAFGNPVSWVPGMLALAWLALNKAKKISGVRLFAVLWFLCTYVPFLLLQRTHMFIYYMLPVLPAYALALSQFLESKKLAKWYLAVLAISLIVFLPIIIGLPAPEWYYAALRPLIGVHPIE
jgi:predicted membrane-bound dolichyl-phosphate-mannose-protein mannosyltransferase